MNHDACSRGAYACRQSVAHTCGVLYIYISYSGFPGIHGWRRCRAQKMPHTSEPDAEECMHDPQYRSMHVWAIRRWSKTANAATRQPHMACGIRPSSIPRACAASCTNCKDLLLPPNSFTRADTAAHNWFAVCCKNLLSWTLGCSSLTEAHKSPRSAEARPDCDQDLSADSNSASFWLSCLSNQKPSGPEGCCSV